LGLVGNIWRMTQRTAERLADIESADYWAEQLSQKGPLGSVAILKFMTVPFAFPSRLLTDAASL